jgi:hypothetical protein
VTSYQRKTCASSLRKTSASTLNGTGGLKANCGLSWQVIHTGSVRQKFTPILIFVGDVCGKSEEAIEFSFPVFGHAPDGAKAVETKVTSSCAMAKARSQTK